MSSYSDTRPFAELRFEPPPVPRECVRWCHAQPYLLKVYEDGSTVDLDWWNARFRQHAIPLSLCGRSLDGEFVAEGHAELTRLDLCKHARFSLPVPDSSIQWEYWLPGIDSVARGAPPAGQVVTTLYLISAWLSAHPVRRHLRRFRQFMQFDTTLGVYFVSPRLARAWESVHDPRDALESLMNYRGSRLMPKAPGFGWTLASHLLAIRSAATHGPTLVPMEPAAVDMLCVLGWREYEPHLQPTPRRYLQFQETIRLWAQQAETHPELIEQWLVETWARRRLDNVDARQRL